MSKAFALVIVVCVGSAMAAAGETVTLVRDVHGVPHIFASTDEGAMFGAGYAAATDRLYQMHRQRRAVQGRLAELIGLQSGPKGTTVDQDRSFRLRRFYEHCETVAENLDARTASMLEAYADGVNRYMADHALDLHPLFEGEVPEPWLPADSIACWDRVGEFFSGGIPNHEPVQLHAHEASGSCELYWSENSSHVVIDEDAAVVKLDDVSQETLDALCAFAESKGYPCPTDSSVQTGSPTTQGRLHATDITYPKFSHAWVVGGSALRGGSTALHTDPQTAVVAPSFGHEMHVVGETFDVRGLTFPGSPGFLVGYTPYVAWGVTAMGLDQEDTFRLDSSPGGWGYRYDGEWKLVETRNEWIRVRTETGFDELPIQVRWTDMGPEVTELLDDVQPGEHYVLSAVPLVDTDRHTIQALLAMMSARSASEFAEATHDWRSPSVHCVYGDVDGAVGYAALAAVPIRSPDTCLGGTSSQDGSLSSLAWQGFIPADLLPALSLPDGGAISSANNIPVGPWYPIPLHLGTGGSGDSRRSWRLRERLTMAPGGQPFTPSQVLAVHRDDVNPVRRAIVGTALFLREQVPTIFSGGANRALDALESWFEAGAHSSLDEPNFALAWHLYTKFRMDDWPDLVPIWGSNNLTHMLKDFERRTEAHTHEPAEFSIDEVAFLNYALATAWHDVRLRYGGTPRQWQAGIQAVLGRVRVRYFSTLEGFGSIDPDQDVIVTGFTTPDGGTLSNQRGQAFSLFTHLARTDTSVGLNPIGGSEHVQSPNFDVAIDDWADGVLRSAGLTVEPFEVAETTVLDWNGP